MMRHMNNNTLFNLSKRKHARVHLSGATSVKHKEKKKIFFLVSRNSQSAPTQWVMKRESLQALEDLKNPRKLKHKMYNKNCRGKKKANQSSYTVVT